MELDGSAVEAFVKVMMSVKNNTRLWANKGYTPNELAALYYWGCADSGRDRQKENRPERSLSLRQRKKVQEVLRTVTEVWTPLPF